MVVVKEMLIVLQLRSNVRDSVANLKDKMHVMAIKKLGNVMILFKNTTSTLLQEAVQSSIILDVVAIPTDSLL